MGYPPLISHRTTPRQRYTQHMPPMRRTAPPTLNRLWELTPIDAARYPETSEKMRKVNNLSTFRCTGGVLEEVLHVQLDNALVWSSRLAVHDAELRSVVVGRECFAVVVHVVTQCQRPAAVSRAEVRQWVVEPVESTGAELDLLSFMTGDRERPVKCQIVIEVSCSAYIGKA